jgi:molybdate transport system substrate-binding protein
LSDRPFFVTLIEKRNGKVCEEEGMSFPRIVLCLALLILVAMFSGCTDAKPEHAEKQVIVSAAISLQAALDTIKKQYERDHPGTVITYNYGSSGSLQKQIEQGAPVDLFISAGQKQMDALEKQRLIDQDTRGVLVSNRLVLIAPKEDGRLKGFPDLSKAKLVAIGEPNSVPAGEYARQVLTKLGLWTQLEAGKLSFGKDVKQVLAYVETGSVDAGLVYRTDVSEKVRIVAEAPPESHKAILYPYAIVAASQQKEAAAAFARYLKKPQAQQIFASYGFEPESTGGN